MQLGKLQKVEKELVAKGFRLLACSADRPEKLEPLIAKHELSYTLLSDARMEGARAFGIAYRVDDATLERYEGFGIDLEEASGETHHLLPVPAVFLIDRETVIRFAYANPDYKVRLPTDELLAAAERIASESP